MDGGSFVNYELGISFKKKKIREREEEGTKTTFKAKLMISVGVG